MKNHTFSWQNIQKYWCKIGTAACSLKSGLSWRTGPAEYLHYQHSNDTQLHHFCSHLQDALRVHEIQRVLKKLQRFNTDWTEFPIVWRKSECSNISTSSMMHSIKCWLAALIFWGEIKYLKQKHNKLFNNSVISRSRADRPYKTVTFTSLCGNKNVLNLTWFVIGMVGFFPTAFSQAGDWGAFVAFYSVLRGLDIWNDSLHYLNFGS